MNVVQTERRGEQYFRGIKVYSREQSWGRSLTLDGTWERRRQQYPLTGQFLGHIKHTKRKIDQETFL